MSPRASPGAWALLTLFAALSLFAGAGEDPPQAEGGETLTWTVLDERGGEGELCIVCRQQIFGKDVLEIRCKGRRFFVSVDMRKDFEADPARYFRSLEARSGLFDEGAVGRGALGTGWLVLGSYVFVGLVFAALCGYQAISRGHAPLPWFFAGLAGNVAAFAVLLVTPRGAAPAGVRSRVPAACPQCGEPNHPAAAACSGCGGELHPSIEAETARV